jgi:NAD(P)H-hydrate epimerase
MPNYTVSFQLPKLAFLFPGNYSFVGEWTIVDIGLNKGFIKRAETENFYLTPKDPRLILKKRSKFDHKGNYGHGLIVAGSLGKMGAAILAARAACAQGSGYFQFMSRNVVILSFRHRWPKRWLRWINTKSTLRQPLISKNITAIGIGPGLGNAEDTVKAYEGLLRQFGKPMVIDADALNMLGENRGLLQLIPAGSILTPHPKEFERIVGKWESDFDRMDKQKRLAVQLKSVVVLKGANSAIASPEGKVYFNSTGNPGMATGGSGDVLTGILTGLLAQGYEPCEAAILGVYLHGLAGDLAVLEYGMNSLVASDLINYLPSAFLRIQRQ